MPLQESGGTDDLGAAGMLREAGRIAESCGAIASGVPADELADLHDVCWATPADIGYHFRCIVAELLLDQLEHAVRVLEG